jgi:WD40 repeat protein
MSRVCSTALLAVWMAALLAPAAAQQAGKDTLPAIASPDGKLLITASDRTISVSDIQNQRDLIRMQGHKDRVTALAITPDGKVLASGGADRAINLWDLATGRLLQRFQAEVAVAAVSFTQDGAHLNAILADKSKRRWEVATGKEVK